MRDRTAIRLTQAGHLPSFSGRSRPHFSQRVFSSTSLIASGSPFASCSMPRAISENRGAIEAEKVATGTTPLTVVSSSRAPPTSGSVRADLMSAIGTEKSSVPAAS
jgi:hypothetical protein